MASSETKPSIENRIEDQILEAFRQHIVNLILNTNRIAESLAVNPSDLQVLHAVELAGAITPKELAAQAHLTTGGITVVLDRLEKEGLIRREKNPADRRSLLITLNEGPRLDEVHAAYAVYADDLLKILSHYTGNDLQTILRFLDELNGSGA
jgi:DNA-binding MarR family transcriptional regulator